ncbi:MAG: UDP-glucose/GDP-mannose dehydrogenase family protein [Phycisphaerales bacterium]|jgi:UDPglucose 6-dehydrogenase/GDP-mannose 6-dehydrogenase|nr:UDP-glucose/GDP-mannose dehydrogenase family protein [Phycisphaerales bacterium]
MNISIIGTGYVGLVSGVCLAELGHTVWCVDREKQKVDEITAGRSPIHEDGLTQLLGRNINGRLHATTDLREAVLKSDLTMIAVGTPFDGKQIDLSQIHQTARQIGEALSKKNGYHVVVIKSTVVPGTTQVDVLPILENASGKKAGRDFGVGMNPEFLSEGNAVADFMSPDRIVLGGIDERTIEAMEKLYAPMDASVPRMRTAVRTAEMIKYASNALQATMISFANEMANLCAAMEGVDVVNVMRGVHLMRPLSPKLDDGRTISAGITHFLNAGCGFGGSCFPKDIKALAAHAAQINVPTPLLDAVLKTNGAQPHRVVELLREHLGRPLDGAKVAVTGLAFKPGTDDLRESPAIVVIEELLRCGAKVSAFDPAAGANAKKHFGTRIRIESTLAAAIEGVDAIAIVTSWPEFTQIPKLIAGRSNPPLVVDGRRMLDVNSVSRYAGIGLSVGQKRGAGQ